MTEKRGAGAAVTVLGQESQAALEIESMLRAAPEEEEKAARSDFSLRGRAHQFPPGFVDGNFVFVNKIDSKLETRLKSKLISKLK